MSDLNDAKQLILETEIDDVIEEGFLGGLNKVKFEVAAVLAGAGALLFKLPEYIAKKIASDDISRYDFDKMMYNLGKPALESKVSVFNHLADAHNQLAARIGSKIDDNVVTISNKLDASNWEIGKPFDDLVHELTKGTSSSAQSVNMHINNSIDTIKVLLRSPTEAQLTPNDDKLFKWAVSKLEKTKQMYNDFNRSSLDLAESQKQLTDSIRDSKIEHSNLVALRSSIREHVSNSTHNVQLIIAIMIGVAVISIIFKLWKYFKSNPDEKKAKLKSVLSNFKSSLMKLKRIK